jgi:hypothetical protein
MVQDMWQKHPEAYAACYKDAFIPGSFSTTKAAAAGYASTDAYEWALRSPESKRRNKNKRQLKRKQMSAEDKKAESDKRCERRRQQKARDRIEHPIYIAPKHDYAACRSNHCGACSRRKQNLKEVNKRLDEQARATAKAVIDQEEAVRAQAENVSRESVSTSWAAQQSAFETARRAADPIQQAAEAATAIARRGCVAAGCDAQETASAAVAAGRGAQAAAEDAAIAQLPFGSRHI